MALNWRSCVHKVWPSLSQYHDTQSALDQVMLDCTNSASHQNVIQIAYLFSLLKTVSTISGAFSCIAHSDPAVLDASHWIEFASIRRRACMARLYGTPRFLQWLGLYGTPVYFACIPRDHGCSGSAAPRSASLIAPNSYPRLPARLLCHMPCPLTASVWSSA